jgi:hypothetical protein
MTPTTESKTTVDLHSVKTITGRTVLMHGDDAPVYRSLIDSYFKEFQPVGIVEAGLVQSLVDTCWRLDRIPGLEYALISLGRAQASPDTPSLVAEMQTRIVQDKQFRNLQLQESRLVRRREKDMKELRALQEARKAKETEELNRAAQAALLAQKQNQPFDLAAHGFVFSTDKFNAHMAKLTPATKQNLLKEAIETQAAAA